MKKIKKLVLLTLCLSFLLGTTVPPVDGSEFMPYDNQQIEQEIE